jgi:hypothetical protein
MQSVRLLENCKGQGWPTRRTRWTAGQSGSVQRRLLVLEDIYRNGFERATTRFVDAITNAQLFGEPHSNRSLEDRIELVNQLSLRLVHTSESFVWFGFLRLRQALLVIERA